MLQKNVVVAFGGVSPEHEVSVLSAMQAIAALKNSDYHVQPLYITKSGRWLTGEYLLDLEHYRDLKKLAEESISCTFSHDDNGKPVLLETESKGFFSSPQQHDIHAVIPAFHGSEGENGGFQGICETYDIPYAGSGVLASSLGMDKVKSKELCRTHGIPVVEGVDFSESEWEHSRQEIVERIEQLSYPVILKPVSLGSSIGVQGVSEREELIEAIEFTFRYDANLLVEKTVSPLREINCSVLGSPGDARASVCERPLGKEETLSFEDKYQGDSSSAKGMASADRVIPADIPDDLSERIQSLSLEIFRLFRASGVARLDFLFNSDTEELYFNEINTIPGSFSFYLWEESGVEISQLMLELIDIALSRHRRKIGRVRSYDTNLLDEKAVKGIKGLKGPGS
ncbi:MAG: D-alanine--D-alanine ligase family protein [Balneolaceae bacterium]|nr:D-alanine--D-alanine ligase family protein [Balneolaceae bacterium]